MLRGIQDVPQAGHSDPEILTYFRRVRGGDEFRANDEVIDRFIAGGKVDEQDVRRAAPGGDRDITYLITPSRQRALLLDKAYMVLVREQTFEQGRDAVIRPFANVHPSIRNGSTALDKSDLVFGDGKLWLEWRAADDHEPPGPSKLLPGDCNADGSLDVADAVCLLNFLFVGRQRLPCGDGSLGDASNRELVNFDGAGQVNVTDAIGFLSWSFLGSAPHALGRECREFPGCPERCPGN